MVNLLLVFNFHCWYKLKWFIWSFGLKWWKWSCCCWWIHDYMIWMLLVMIIHEWVMIRLSCCCCYCDVFGWIKMLLLELWCFMWKLIELLHKLFWGLWKEFIWCVWALENDFNGFGKKGNLNKYFWGVFDENPRSKHTKRTFFVAPAPALTR